MKSLALLVFLVFFVGCGVNYDTIAQGSTSGINERQELVIMDEEAFKELWDAHYSTRFPPAELPVIDFEEEMVIAVFYGMAPTTGYGIRISRITESKDMLRVRIKTSRPMGGRAFMALTQPYHIVKLKKSEKPVEFVR